MEETKTKKFPIRDFVIAFIKERGNKVKACRKVGIGLYALDEETKTNASLRRFLSEHWYEAIELLRWKAMQIACNGYMKPVWFRGVQCGTERVYLPQLQMFMLSKLLPEEFGDKVGASEKFSPEDYVRLLKMADLESTSRMTIAETNGNSNGNGTHE